MSRGQEFAAAFQEFISRPAADRNSEAINHWLEQHRDSLTRIGNQLAQHRGMGDAPEEAVQCVFEGAWALLSEDPPPERITSPAGVIIRRGSQVLSRRLNAGSAGQVNVNRRRHQLARTREALIILLGRTPTDEEVLEAHNAHVSANVNDPERHGSYASWEDLAVKPTLALDEMQEDPRSPDWGDPQLHVEDDTALSAIRLILAKTIQRCREEGSFIGQAAERIIGPLLLDSLPENDAEIARQLDVHRSTVGRARNRIREILAEVAPEIADRLVKDDGLDD